MRSFICFDGGAQCWVVYVGSLSWAFEGAWGYVLYSEESRRDVSGPPINRGDEATPGHVAGLEREGGACEGENGREGVGAGETSPTREFVDEAESRLSVAFFRLCNPQTSQRELNR